MSITHHPGDTALAAFASGRLDEARALMIASHLSLCNGCREAVRAFEHLGGALLDQLTPSDLNTGALEIAMARLDRPPADADVRNSNLSRLSAPLAQYDLSPWRRIGRGVQWRSVAVDSTESYRVFMLKAQPGTRLPRHRHTDTEWTCILEGAFRHEFGRYGPGDFDEADHTVAHHPVVEDEVPCICLVALKGSLELQGWVGRLLGPFIRI